MPVVLCITVFEDNVTFVKILQTSLVCGHTKVVCRSSVPLTVPFLHQEGENSVPLTVLPCCNKYVVCTIVEFYPDRLSVIVCVVDALTGLVSCV